ncbi:MAG: hypothetical protein JWQ70_524 [Aeromicrobium sp.]|jgi:hypothetical protein|nr:hypothetical protein [Aeromicrobium sp.]
MPSSEPAPESSDSEREAERRRRAAELLGDLLPTTTTDDTDEGWGEQAAPTSDEEFLRDVPPHHG